MNKFKRLLRGALGPIVMTKSATIWTGALFALVLVGPALEHAGWASPGVASHAGPALAGAQPDPLLAFSQRSPGARGSGAMLQTKNRLASVGNPAVTPEERVLSNIRYAPPGLGMPAINDVIPASFGPIGAPAFSGPAIPVISSGPGVPYYTGGTTGGGGGGGGGSGGGGGGSGTPTPPVTSAVPEPSTWAMLMIGMFLMGSGLRSTRRRLAGSPAAAIVLGDDGVDTSAATSKIN